ncbi:MAG: hypothetical protein JW737_00290 [Acidobacteria bacterium]|nr:hypothetical protein [Acidobacteriota bacterium]
MNKEEKEEKQIGEKLARMAQLKAEFKPLKAKADEFNALQQEIIDWGLKKGSGYEKSFEHGSVKVSSGRGKLVPVSDEMTVRKAFLAAAEKAKANGWKRFFKTVYEIVANRVKEEATEEQLKELGLKVAIEDSVKVETW